MSPPPAPRPWARLFVHAQPLQVLELRHHIPDAAQVGSTGAAVRAGSMQLHPARLEDLQAEPGSRAGIWFRFFNSCNLRCQYCNEPAKPANPIHIPRALDTLGQLARQGFERITLSGGEPTLVPGLAEFIAALRERGFKWISLATNGYRLAEAGGEQGWKRGWEKALAGLDEIYLSLHGLDAASGAAITGQADYWARMETLLAALRPHAQRLHLGLNHPITTHTAALLERLPALVAASGARSLQLSLMEQYEDEDSGPAAARAAALIPALPSFSPALPGLHQALQAQGCALTLEGIPPCHLAGVESCYLDYRRARSHMLRVIYDNGGEADQIQFSRGSSREVGKVYASACGECAYRSHCCGIYHSYLKRHGEADLRPVSPTEAAARIHARRRTG
ncbi:radical SAM protein [Zoogloea sp.]|uniref:radical SAM protein n=1 Tax=Zoogloea sp. TaxID=49181 RepID=UPI0035AE1B74